MGRLEKAVQFDFSDLENPTVTWDAYRKLECSARSKQCKFMVAPRMFKLNAEELPGSAIELTQ